jgi:hypothetical protein
LNCANTSGSAGEPLVGGRPAHNVRVNHSSQGYYNKQSCAQLYFDHRAQVDYFGHVDNRGQDGHQEEVVVEEVVVVDGALPW